jgi:hypothetical protein
MTRVTGLVAATLCALAAGASSAGAAVWTAPLARCYVSVGAQGFPPLAPVDVLLDGQPADATDDGQPDPFYADPSGEVTARLRVPYQPADERPFALTVTEQANSANTVTVTSRVTALAATLRPAKAPPSKRVEFAGRGFTKPAPVWGHYLYRGILRRTVRLVRRPDGDCGTFSVHDRQIPVPRPRIGKWTLPVDQQKAFARAPDSVFVRITITVGRRIRKATAA